MKHALIAVDFSPGAGRVLDVALELARERGLSVSLVHVAPPDPDFVGYGPGPKTVRDTAAQHLRQEHRDLHAQEDRFRAAGIQCHALLVQGFPGDMIVKEAQRLGADLIVMGSHGHGMLRHLVVGSVTDAVLRKTPCPVLVVPTRSA